MHNTRIGIEMDPTKKHSLQGIGLSKIHKRTNNDLKLQTLYETNHAKRPMSTDIGLSTCQP